jgi:rhodanese-related sulfurtransferase
MLKRALPLALTLLIATFALAGAATASGGVADYSEIMKLMSSERGSLYLLDVRTPGEFSQGHIPGSVLIPMNQIQGRVNQIPRDKKVVVICATGARSGAVTRFLAGQGFPWVKNYAQGIVDWSRRGLPLNR